MKIAVATIDGISLSQHFGQSKGFVVFDVEGSTVRSREFRTSETRRIIREFAITGPINRRKATVA